MRSEANREAARKYRASHPEQVRASARACQAKRHKLKRTLIDGAKNRPCMDCGNRFPPFCMDFDHRPGTKKKFHVAACGNKSFGAILAEIAKCDLVCAICHRIRTWKRSRNAR